MIRHRTARLAALSLALFSALSLGCAKTQNELVIGEYGSLTGTTATFGTSTKNGIELYMDNVNAGGGIGGVKVRVGSRLYDASLKSKLDSLKFALKRA